MAGEKDDGIIPTTFDVEADPNADGFDPIAWYEGTGQDLGLPESYKRRTPEQQAMLDDAMARYPKEWLTDEAAVTSVTINGQPVREAPDSSEEFEEA